MKSEQFKSFQSWYLRLLPITLPFAVILMATIGLADQSQGLPSVQTIIYVFVGATLSVVLPLSFVFGVFMLIANALHESKRHYYFAISILVVLVMLVYAYKVGVSLYF